MGHNGKLVRTGRGGATTEPFPDGTGAFGFSPNGTRIRTACPKQVYLATSLGITHCPFINSSSIAPATLRAVLVEGGTRRGKKNKPQRLVNESSGIGIH